MTKAVRATRPASTANAAAPAVPALTLDDLSALSTDKLAELYAAGTVPADISGLENHPRGRMVAIRGLASTPVVGNAIVAFSKAAHFPWHGKSFKLDSEDTTTGINRMHVLGLVKRDLFVFKTRVEASVIDGEPTIVLDYVQKGNPFFIKAIHDEIREVAPGVFLGPAMAKVGKGAPKLVLWFALDTNK